jgi:hypothetical protein
MSARVDEPTSPSSITIRGSSVASAATVSPEISRIGRPIGSLSLASESVTP